MTAPTRSRRRWGTWRIVKRVLWWLAIVLVACSTVGPLLWTLSTSLKPVGEIVSGYLEVVPRNPTLDNYVRLFEATPFARYMLNSGIIAIVGTATNVFFGALGGYALAKLHFRGRRAVFSAFLASMMVPAVVTMIPTFLVLRFFPLAGGNDLFGQGGVGFINNFAAVIIPFAAGPFAVFFMKQFFESLPDELGEAARIDGASEFAVFLRVYFPLAGPGLAVLGILTFQAGWNGFLWPLIVLNDPQQYTVQVALASFVNANTVEYGPLMAGAIVASLPVLIIFIVAQKYIIQGFATSGTK